MSKEAVTAASERLIKEYKLDPHFAMVCVRAGPDDIIHIFTIRGREHMMPEIPQTFEGFPIEHSKCGRPKFLAA